MAGDWIKMRCNLHTCPQVVRMASALDADRLRIVGGLHAVWCLFDMHSEDGHLSGYTPAIVDQIIGFAGFCAAMAEVDWLTVCDDGGLQMPDFEAHNGQSAKRRAQEAERKRRARNASASDADKKRTREEKRREEKSKEKTSQKRRLDLTAIPDDWRVVATEKGVDPDREFERFRNHAEQNDRKAVNWKAAFRNWCLKAEEIQPSKTKNDIWKGVII